MIYNSAFPKEPELTAYSRGSYETGGSRWTDGGSAVDKWGSTLQGRSRPPREFQRGGENVQIFPNATDQRLLPLRCALWGCIPRILFGNGVIIYGCVQTGFATKSVHISDGVLMPNKQKSLLAIGFGPEDVRSPCWLWLDGPRARGRSVSVHQGLAECLVHCGPSINTCWTKVRIPSVDADTTSRQNKLYFLT